MTDGFGAARNPTATQLWKIPAELENEGGHCLKAPQLSQDSQDSSEAAEANVKAPSADLWARTEPDHQE